MSAKAYSPTAVLETQCSRAGTSGSPVARAAPVAKAFPCSTHPRRPASRTSPPRSTSCTGQVRLKATSVRTLSRWLVSRCRTKVLVRRDALRCGVMGSLIGLRVHSRGGCGVDRPPHVTGVWTHGLGLADDLDFGGDAVLANSCE